MASNNVMTTENSGENTSNKKSHGLGRNQMRNHEGSFPLLSGESKEDDEKPNEKSEIIVRRD
jgi:hypothetical protein